MLTHMGYAGWWHYCIIQCTMTLSSILLKLKGPLICIGNDVETKLTKPIKHGLNWAVTEVHLAHNIPAH